MVLFVFVKPEERPSALEQQRGHEPEDERDHEMGPNEIRPVFFCKARDSFGEFSQWYPSPFTYEGMWFATAEQFMMYMKATMFGDVEVAGKILSTPWAHPAEHKRMGRTVRGFDNGRWNRECMWGRGHGQHPQVQPERGPEEAPADDQGHDAGRGQPLGQDLGGSASTRTAP